MAPSRRRGPSGKTSATTARSAAIQAAEKRRQEEREDRSNNNINNKQNDHENSTAKSVRANNNTTTGTGTSAITSTASSQEVLVTASKQLLHSQPFCKVVPEDQHFRTICDQRSKCEKMLYKQRQDFEYLERGYNDDDDDDDQGCLHCHRKVKNTPRIEILEDGEGDDNNSNGGYVGDSKIQVRCDDCRGYICNECHWCHEFQANHEIRVCDRCDSFYCRGCDEMDQCDDCGEVVCGGCSTLLSCKFCGGGLCEDCATACGRCGIVLCSRDAKFAVDCDTCRLSYCLVCLASGSKDPCVRCGHRPSKRMEQLVHLRLKSIYKAFKSGSSSSANIGGSSTGGGGGNHSNSTTSSNGGRGNTNDENKNDSHGGRSRRNKPTTLQDMVGDHDEEDVDLAMTIGASGGVLPHTFCHDLEQNYLAEKKKADAAAEALLAELEEEETAIAQKKSKKKKKKERKNANKQSKPATNGNQGDDGDKNTEGKQNGSQNYVSLRDSRKEEVNVDPSSETDSTDEDKKVNDKAGDKYQQAEETKMDPIEKELVECVNNADLEGIESILFRLKGVPGRAALRKNAKKALKRLKLELIPPPLPQAEPKVDVAAKKDRKSTIVANRTSSTTSKVPMISANSKPSSKNSIVEKLGFNSTKATHIKSSQRKNNSANRCEAQVEIVSRLVGWMIGKNGQRIRDLMEESGAKIWIDQEKIKGQETRNVYISGNRKSVDHAVLLVKEVITNAPPPQGTTNPIAGTTISMANMAISQKTHDNVVSASGVVSPPTVPSVQSTSSGKVEVKSAWAKASGSGRAEATTQGMVPKPPPFISSSEAVSFEKSKEGAKAKTGHVIQDMESIRNEQALDLLTGVPKAVVDTSIAAVDLSKKSNLQPSSPETTTEIVTCDVRFVPLLIGKRGWTIKNIQDDSGARVDIDQTVTPRQVRISGRKENVEKAVTMVRDVLSYPHAQLQSCADGAGSDVDVPESGANMRDPEVDKPISTPTKENLAAASAILENDMIRKNRQRGNGDRVHSPPPVVGDAKTAISASSSLSSTPEPSMASSSKGFIPSHLRNCPPLPPPAEHYILGNSASQPLARQFLQPERGFVNGMNAGGLWTSAPLEPGARNTMAPQTPYIGGSGQVDLQGGGPISVSHAAPSHPQIQHLPQQGRHLQMNATHEPSQQLLQGNPNHNQNTQQPFVPIGEMMHRTAIQANMNGGPMDRGSQFSNQHVGNNHNLNSSYNVYGNEDQPAARPLTSTPLRDLVPPPGVASGPIPSSPLRGPGFIDKGNRLWNSGNPQYPPSGLIAQASGLPPQASSGFASTSAGYSSGHDLQANEPGIGYPHSQAMPPHQSRSSTNSLSLPANTTSAFSGSLASGLRNDDSRMIDSLFGGGPDVQPSNAAGTNGLLSGFNGLALPKEAGGANQSGLWGSTNLTETWRESGPDGPIGTSIDNIFANEVPNLSQGHPEESRFNWD